MMDYNNTPFKNRDIDRLTKKTTKTPDSFMENAIEIVDPTGISSWDDVYRSVKKNGLMSGETALEVFGAIPLIGKVGKAGKIAKAAVEGVQLTSRQARNIKQFSTGTKLIGKYGGRLQKASDLTQFDDLGIKRSMQTKPVTVSNKPPKNDHPKKTQGYR